MKTLNESLTQISLFQARQLRRSGMLKRASHNLYQDADTKDFWQINKQTGKVERIIAVDDTGFTKE